VRGKEFFQRELVTSVLTPMGPTNQQGGKKGPKKMLPVHAKLTGGPPSSKKIPLTNDASSASSRKEVPREKRNGGSERRKMQQRVQRA